MANQILSLNEVASCLMEIARKFQVENDLTDKDVIDGIRIFGASIGAPVDISDLMSEDSNG